MKILVIEDDADMREIIARSLRKERYVVETAETYRAARAKAMGYEYDCLLLDIMLPDGNGLDLLAELQRAGRRTNVIILSARHLAELHARLKSVLRRRRGGERLLRCGNVTADPEHFRVEVEGRPLELGRKEYDILVYFLNRPGRLVEKQTLAEAVWGDHIDQADNFDFIYAQMKNLRKRLKDAGATIEIKTAYGFGYKLAEL